MAGKVHPDTLRHVAVLRERLAQGATVPQVAVELGITVAAAENLVARYRARAPEGPLPADTNEAPAPIASPLGRKPRLSHVVDLDPVPFAVPIPRPAKVSPGTPRRIVVYTDTHFGFEDPGALAVVLGVIKDVRPDTIIHLGDLVDCYSISRFDKDPQRLESLQDEIDRARAHLHQVAQLVPEARRVLLEGNHEDRLRRLLWSLPDTARELNRLRAFTAAMTWPNLLDLAGCGWDYVPSAGQSRVRLLPNQITKHGTVVRKHSGMSGKGEWERYAQSGLSGHVHRLGSFYANDRNGAHTWVECGCTCRTDPVYMDDPNWQQGCVVVEYNAAGTWFTNHLVYIQDGRALWRGQEYKAA